VINGQATTNLDTPGNDQALINAAALMLESSASLSTNCLGKLLSLGLRIGGELSHEWRSAEDFAAS